MIGTPLKIAFAVFVVLLAAVFLWRPLTLPFSGAVSTNDFVLQTTQGVFDSKSQRGKVMVVVFGHGDCQATCSGYIKRLAQSYELLSAVERSMVRLVLISAHPEKDTLARIAEYAAGFHPDFIALSGTPEGIQPVADGFAAIIKKGGVLPDGSPTVAVTPMIYVVDAEGRFTSVLNENLKPEDIAQSIRSRIPTQLPPGR